MKDRTDLMQEISDMEAKEWEEFKANVLCGLGPKGNYGLGPEAEWVKGKPLFDDLADETLERVKSTYTYEHKDGRGAQYGDTMRECQFLTMQAVGKFLFKDGREYRLAMFLAGMVDMKLERMRGGYRDDNLVDLIAYAAALAELMKRQT